MDLNLTCYYFMSPNGPTSVLTSWAFIQYYPVANSQLLSLFLVFFLRIDSQRLLMRVNLLKMIVMTMQIIWILDHQL
ncbi:hypothetical protein CLU79DRAFT_740793 [Phycomyces nitens]|nr:hypothetical protein CLU79DRAFT_740793 [Phycomyces nitens]